MSTHAAEGAKPAAEPAGEPAAVSADLSATAETVPADSEPADSEPAQVVAARTVRARAAASAKAAPSRPRARAGTGRAAQTQAVAAADAATDDSVAAEPAAVSAVAADTPAPELAGSDPGATTLLLDPEPAPELAGPDPGATTLLLDPEPAPGLAGQDPGGTTLPYDPGPAPEPADLADEPVSKLAVAALVTSAVALIPVAVACAIGALVGIRRSGKRGHGMAVGALFVCAAWLIVAGAVGTIGVLTHGFHKPVTIKYKEAAVFKLQVGDCVSSPSAQVVAILPCYSPHKAEVFATFSLPGTAWPGTAAVSRQASNGCGDRLSGYLNPELAISLTQSYIYPDKVAWTAGTRTVICEVRATSGELTSSVRGAG